LTLGQAPPQRVDGPAAAALQRGGDRHARLGRPGRPPPRRAARGAGPRGRCQRGHMSGAEAPALRPIKGPTAVGSDLRRMMHLTVTLAVMEFKLRFFGSVLGYLWQLMRPLMLFGVLYLVFTQFVRIAGGVRHYQAILLTGIVLYTFFSDATMGSVTSVYDREGLVRKIEFPRLVVPMSVLLTAYF